MNTTTITAQAVVQRIRSKSGDRDYDYFQGQCSVCPWEGAYHSNRTVEGRTLADLSGDLLDPEARRRAAAERATDAIRARFGAEAIIKGRSLR